MPLRTRGILLYLLLVLPLGGLSTSITLADKPASYDASDRSQALQWRDRQIEALTTQISAAKDDADSPELDMRKEWQARREWLQRWEPGQMPAEPSKPAGALTAEPDLAEVLDRMSPDNAFQQDLLQRLEHAAALQRQLRAMDSMENRKANLIGTAERAHQLDLQLQEVIDRLDAEPASDIGQDSVRTPIRWALAYTRYRRARAIAYRELDDVLATLPIEDAVQYEQQLAAAHQRLLGTFDGPQPEFVLLEIRMLRRSGARGQALERLERFSSTIDPRWYLKKRRDLLEELGWEPPHAEAAAIYAASGLERP